MEKDKVIKILSAILNIVEITEYEIEQIANQAELNTEETLDIIENITNLNVSLLDFE